MRYSIRLVVVCLILTSCTEKDRRIQFKNEAGLLIKRSFYTDSTIRSEDSFKEDSIREGWSRSFYPSGQLELATQYSNGKENGLVRAYYENGRVEFEGRFLDGKADSSFTLYFQNGKMKEIYHLLDATIFGDHRIFYENGLINKYFWHNLSGKIVFSRSYNMKGEYVDNGSLLHTVYDPDEDFKRNEQIELLMYPVSPPNCRIKLVFEDMSADNKVIKTIKIKQTDLQHPYYSAKFLYRTKAASVGKFGIRCYMTLQDTLLSKTSKDSLTMKYNILK
jgi:antitoxin component YwqK of YwqJK toxin-antitoxin module